MSPKVAINMKGANRVKGGHPWVFRSDVVSASEAQPGDVVSVFSPSKKFLGQAFFNPRSQITLRFLTRREGKIDTDFFRKRITQAIGRRKPFGEGREAIRLVFGEADFLPALIVDRYRDVLVFQTLSLGMDLRRETILDLLEEILHPQAIVERNDPPVRELEGLPRQSGIVRGGLSGSLEIRERGRLFRVDPLEGQKTGLFLDQSDNHQATASYARGQLLDLFCYQGGFSVAASDKAQEVVAVDSSAPALEVFRENCLLNDIQNVTPVAANGFDYLRQCQERRELFDTVILDPPPFARDRKNIGAGLRGYKEINLRALKILRSGGILASCSCSWNFTPDLFAKTLLEAAHDAHREIQLLERRGASPDHPVLLTFPESSYLQCWVVRVV